MRCHSTASERGRGGTWILNRGCGRRNHVFLTKKTSGVLKDVDMTKYMCIVRILCILHKIIYIYIYV